MNHTAHKLRINVGFLVNQPPGFQREIPFEFDNYELDEEYVTEDLHGIITLARTQNGVHALVEASADITLECGRCLEEYSQKLQSEFEEIFTFSNRPLSEDETIIPEDGNIDFAPIIREYLFLEIPYIPICRSDCKGLCITCGQNLNDEICEHMEKNFAKDKDSSAIKGSHQSR